MREWLKKYHRYGRPAGTVRLDDATQEECAAARGIFGRPFSPPLRFQTAQFEAALQELRFGKISLKEVLESYFDIEIKTKNELRELESNRFSAMLTQVLEQTDNSACVRWLQTLSNSQGGGYQLLRREAVKDLDGTRRSLLQACRSLDWLERHTQGAVRLAVLSAQSTSDPHALDSGTSLYYENSILCDSISSLVSQTGLVLYTGKEEHPAYQLLRQSHEICTLSLANLSRLTGACSPSGRVYIVENEMVFTQLCDRSAQFHSPLICTSGQPSVAALRLLDLLAAEGTQLFYSGDFDGKGLSIATQLCRRYPALLLPWHMTLKDYDLCRSDVLLGDSSRSLLQGCVGTALETSAEAVKQFNRAGYQELLIPLLETDLTETL